MDTTPGVPILMRAYNEYDHVCEECKAQVSRRYALFCAWCHVFYCAHYAQFDDEFAPEGEAYRCLDCMSELTTWEWYVTH